MNFTIFQIIAIGLYAFLAINESFISSSLNRPVVAGTIIGWIMGDIQTGMQIGATLNLMQLGVAAFGGASIPDFLTASILGTAFAIISGQGMEFGLAIAIPVALLMMQMDILARFLNVFILHRVDRAIERGQVNKIRPLVLSGAFSWGLSRAIPVWLMLIVGQNAVEWVTTNIPDFLMGGLRVAGGLLPVVGIAILLRYLPLKNYFHFLILGFVLAAYIAMPVMGVTLIAIVCAMVVYKKETSSNSTEGKMVNIQKLEGGFGGDE